MKNKRKYNDNALDYQPCAAKLSDKYIELKICTVMELQQDLAGPTYMSGPGVARLRWFVGLLRVREAVILEKRENKRNTFRNTTFQNVEFCV